MRLFKVSVIVAAFCGFGAASALASDASDDPGQSNNLVSSSASGQASGQTASIIGGAINPGGGGAGPIVTLNNAPDPEAPDQKIPYFNLREMQGRSAGSRPMPFNIWLNGAYTGISKSDQGGEFDGGVFNVVGGFDYKFTKNFQAGIAAGYEDLDIDTDFNNGTFEGSGYTVAGYMGYSFQPKALGNPFVSAVLTGGYSFIDYDTTRNSGGVTGSFDADRYFISSATSSRRM